MSLKLIYGRTGTGKSQYCFNKIKEKIDSDKPIYIIVPEQFSYTAEKRLLETLDSSSSINAEVISFKRMAERIFTEIGGKTKTNLTEAGKAMLLSDILEKQKSKLNFLGKTNSNLELLIKTITECKKHCISEENLKKSIEEFDNQYLRLKIEDILNIYSQYQNAIGLKCIDEDDILTILYNKIAESNIFDNSYIFIDEFSGFTKQEFLIIEELLKKAEEVNITICIDELEQTDFADNDIYFPNKQVALKLIECAKKCNIQIEKPIELKKILKFKNEELKFLEKNIYSFPYKQYIKKVEHIKLFLAENPYAEIDHVAAEIIRLVRDENLKFKDIGLICKNVDTYSSITKAIFSKYEIPVFIDEKGDLSKNIFIKYILSILNIFAKNWSTESVFNYIKTGFPIIREDISKEDIYELENYCSKWEIRGNQWYKEDWTYDVENVNLNNINRVRRIITEPLVIFYNKVKQQKTVEEITKELYCFLETNNIKEKLKLKIDNTKLITEKNLEKEYVSSWNIVMQILDEAVLVFENDKITFERYANIIKTGIEFSSLGRIPQTIDQVTMGDVDRSRSHNIKVAFILGVNDGIFPTVNRQEGFLNDNDRKNLKEYGIELAKGTVENLYDEQFNIYKAFSTAENDIYISYVSTDIQGKAQRPSVLISRIKKIFPELVENSDLTKKRLEITNPKVTFDELLIELQKLSNGEKIEPKWFEIYTWFIKNECWKNRLEKSLDAINYSNNTEQISKKNIDSLYGNILHVSVSKLEQYNKCPFSFFLTYGLKLKEKEELKIKSVDTGSFMHDIINDFFENTENINIKTLEEKKIETIVEEIINRKLGLSKNYIFTSTPRFIALTHRLKEVIIQAVKYIVNQLQNSSFEVLGNEISFTKQVDKNIKIEGKIDRVDIARENGQNFIRIIDYKSSNKDINLNEFMAGTQIQLITYINAISENDIPAGILYFNLIDPIVKSDRNLTEEEIKDKIQKEFRMNGLILADIKVAKMMDNSLERGASNTVPLYIDSKGEISKSRSNAIDKEDFKRLQIKLNNLINQITKEILKGRIDIKPVYSKKNKKSVCEFCQYKSICNFDCNFNAYKYILNKKNEEILAKLKEEI